MNGNSVGWYTTYNHNTTVDGSNIYGKCYGFPRRNLVGGGSINNNTINGTRAIDHSESTTRAVNLYS